MRLNCLSIGQEFKKQMNDWFKLHPEVSHKWFDNSLEIEHPVDPSKTFYFRFDNKLVTIKYLKKSMILKRRNLKIY